MANARINSIDFVLAIVGSSPEGRIEGRTFLQKVAYFINDRLDFGLTFRPYYYGPYSEEIAAATQTLVDIGFLAEYGEPLPGASSDVFERRRYTYRLTEDGAVVLRELENEAPVPQVKVEMQRIMDSPECNYECLSIAAKTHHILKAKAKGGPMKGSEIMELARELGWNIADKDLQRAASFLIGLGLVKESD